MEYRVASSVEEAVALLAGPGHRRAVGGGTDLAVVIADRVIAPDLLVDVAALAELRGIRTTAEGISIGAGVRISEVASAAQLPACLRQGASAIGSPQIRNLATIGGNVCNASPCGDTLAPLVALDAAFVLRSAKGARTVAAAQFFQGPKKTVLVPGEILVEIRIPSRSLVGRSAFRFIGKRNGQAISQVNAAACVHVEKGTVRETRIAVGSVAPVPLRLAKTEALLTGRAVKGLDLGPILAAADGEIAPISDVRASLDYRRLATASLLRDALAEALGS